MDWNEMKSALEKREKEIRRLAKDKRVQPIWDDVLDVMQLRVAVEKQIEGKMRISRNGAVYCPDSLCKEIFYITKMTLPKFCPACGQALDWSNMLVCLPEAECNNPDEEVEIMFFKDGGKYNDDVRIKVGEEAAIIPRGKKVRVKRKIAESIKKQMREEAKDFEEKLLQVCELK